MIKKITLVLIIALFAQHSAYADIPVLDPVMDKMWSTWPQAALFVAGNVVGQALYYAHGDWKKFENYYQGLFWGGINGVGILLLHALIKELWPRGRNFGTLVAAYAGWYCLWNLGRWKNPDYVVPAQFFVPSTLGGFAATGIGMGIDLYNK